MEDISNGQADAAFSRFPQRYHFGMHIGFNFTQPTGGMIGDAPMIFEFSGDDDVWVFIDDVLVLDLGGIHSEIYGTIDFSTGDIFVGRAFDSHGIPENPKDPDNLVTQTTLKAQYEKAGLADTTQWAEQTFASNTSHTLKMFYLERGNYDSSIALRFNLQPLLHQRSWHKMLSRIYGAKLRKFTFLSSRESNIGMHLQVSIEAQNSSLQDSSPLIFSSIRSMHSMISSNSGVSPKIIFFICS